MQRHAFAFVLLAVAVMAPAGVLGWFALRSGPAELALARSEERATHERTAEAIAARIRGKMDALLEREQAREYYEYMNVYSLPRNQQIGSNLAYQTTQLVDNKDPFVNGYVTMDPQGKMETPYALNNPSPAPQQMEQNDSFLARLQNFRQLNKQVQQQARQVKSPQRGSRVNRSTLDANRNSRQWLSQMRRANKGEKAAQEAVQNWNQAQQSDTETVDIQYFDFQIFTLGGESDRDKKGKDPFILALRRVVEKDAKTPRQYFQGFELNLDHLKKVTFPQAIASVPASNFAARVVSRDTEGDRSIVKDLGPLLPTLELRAAPADANAAMKRVEGARARYRLVLISLGAVVAGALLLFWRLLKSEVEFGRRRQDFVSAVTHELKTPLTSIRMYAELLEDRWVEDPDKQRDYYTTIRKESERLSRLIANVLDFSRLERGKRDVKRAMVNPAAVARDAVKPLDNQIRDRGGRLRLEAPETLPPFALDRDAFQQIIINLVDNAVKYGAAGGDIVVNLAMAGDDLVLIVDNQGDEIPRKDRDRIFEDFRRGGGRRTREVSGVGLGLALVRRFARAHGGRAECVDPPRPGARFQVTLRPVEKAV